MGAQLHLTRALPKSKRNISARAEAKAAEVVRVSKEYGEMYFDGPRDYGYGGYRYDGRWVPVARDIIEHFDLKPGDRFLDVGCAKGFLVKDLLNELPGLEVFGLDISEYALRNCPPECVGRLHLGSADRLPFPDNAFKAAISLDTIHNLPRPRAKIALQELQRVASSGAFVKVDSYHTPEQKEIFESWVLTAEFHDYPEGWLKLFEEAGFTGDYDWTVIQ
ncbi:MAG: methyltransferase domain-containing protein [Neomegalonema sp.]|nr:methyltransferase domain-containing protein [Neomegalonema sp.]